MPFHSVIIPTRRRPGVCAETVSSVLQQSVAADEVIVSAVDSSDVDARLDPARVKILFGKMGGTRQRNRAIDQLDPRSEIVSMVDDDVELPEDYLLSVQRIFASKPEVVVSFADVRNFQGATREYARQVLADWPPVDEFREGPSGLGCTMSVRRSVFKHVRFDERLALYGWLDDADFTTRARAYGKSGSYYGSRAVHLVEQAARLSGVRFGYSQVMNPFYIWRKNRQGSFARLLREHWMKGLASNLAGCIRLDKKVDRWGRLRGNLLAYSMIARGRVEPELIEKL